MGTALQGLWAALISIFGAAETVATAANKGAKALEHLADVAEQTAGAYADESRAKREAARKQLQLQLPQP